MIFRKLDYFLSSIREGTCQPNPILVLRGINDDSALAIAKLISSGNCPENIIFNLNENQITDIGLSCLIEAIKSPNCPQKISIELLRNKFSISSAIEFVEVMKRKTRASNEEYYTMPKVPLLNYMLLFDSMTNDVTNIKRLISIGANPLENNHQFKNTPLLWAIANSSLDTALTLLDTEVITDQAIMQKQINETCEFGNSPLLLSIKKGWEHFDTTRRCKLPQSTVAKRLLALGCEVNAKDKNGRTALHYACLHRNIEAIKALIEKGASFVITDNNGITPFSMLFNNFEDVESLLSREVGIFTIKRALWQSNSKFINSCLQIPELKAHPDFPEFEKYINRQIDTPSSDKEITKLDHHHSFYLKCLLSIESTIAGMLLIISGLIYVQPVLTIAGLAASLSSIAVLATNCGLFSQKSAIIPTEIENHLIASF